MRRIWSRVGFEEARAEMSNASAETSNPPVTQAGAPDLGRPEK
jgi:hypothetical protein